MPSRKADTLVWQGHRVKVLDRTGGEVKVGGTLIHFDEPSSSLRDLHGEYFTRDTYLGAQAASSPNSFVLDAMWNHGLAADDRLKPLADHEFMPIRAAVTDTGVMAEIILRERIEYEAMVAEMAERGKLGWSSGTAGHAMRKEKDGRITRWPLVEGSLTPTPAEPRATATVKQAVPLRALTTQPSSEEEDLADEDLAGESLAIEEQIRAIRHSLGRQYQDMRQISALLRKTLTTLQ